jgi:DNA primase
MISRETISKIQDYARIEDVVGDFVNLKRAGANMKGLCPFHDEKSPSFSVSPAKNIYKCFGCGAAGDPIKFVMEHEKMSYPEALRYLAAKYRIEIEETESSNEDKEQQTLRDSLYIAMKYAAQYYHEQLLQEEEGRAVGWSYFKSRGFSERTIEAYQLGYASEAYNAFAGAAAKAGYQTDVLEQAGLVRVKEGRDPYDFFRARVMFPIHNLTGKVVAFGGRILTKDPKQPKYINTPETEIYTKGQLLYGIYQAKAEIRKQDVCYLVEGYTDVLSLYQAGISNVVASSGTALTKEQVKLIRRFTFNIVLLYDGDAAGIKAAIRGVDIMLEEGMDVKVVVLPDGEDPDSYVKAHGSDATLDFIHQSKKDFIFFKSDILLKDAGQDPTKKSQAIRGLVESIALISDQIRRAYYVRECSKLAELPEELLMTEVNKVVVQGLKKRGSTDETSAAQQVLQETHVPAPPPPVPAEQAASYYLQERDLLRVLFLHGHREMGTDETAARVILDEMIEAGAKNPLLERIFHTFNERLIAGESFESLVDFNSYDDPEIRSELIDLMTSPYELSPNWKDKHNILVKGSDDVWEQDVNSALDRYSYVRVLDKLREIDLELKAVDLNDEVAYMSILARKAELQKSKVELGKILGTVIFR